jgi:hypothetical protein
LAQALGIPIKVIGEGILRETFKEEKRLFKKKKEKKR